MSRERVTRVFAGGVLAATACAAKPSPSNIAPRDVTPHAALAAPERLVKGGRFVRGRDGGRPDESPAHTIEVDAFYLDETLVTRERFAAFVAQTAYVTDAERNGFGVGADEGMGDWEWERIPGASFRRPFREATPDHASYLLPDAPVVMVSFDDAVAFCAHFGRRLPTEAEWELAMRAGAERTRYPWGEDPAPNGQYRLNFWQGESHVHNDRLDGFVYVSPVKQYPPNAWGFYDPVGNVWQWTSDWYAETTYRDTHARGIAVNPSGPTSGDRRVVRGGSWWCGACTCEGNGLYYRGKSDPRAPFNNLGFRCARSPR